MITHNHYTINIISQKLVHYIYGSSLSVGQTSYRLVFVYSKNWKFSQFYVHLWYYFNDSPRLTKKSIKTYNCSKSPLMAVLSYKFQEEEEAWQFSDFRHTAGMQYVINFFKVLWKNTLLRKEDVKQHNNHLAISTLESVKNKQHHQRIID